MFGIFATLVGALSFEIASSYIVSRELPIGLAIAVGALAFPVAPLIWQLVGERRRKRKQAAAKMPSKSTLTAGDRYWLRFFAVTLLVIGPMVAISKLGVVRAPLHHGLWWLPAGGEPSAPKQTPDAPRIVPAPSAR